LLLASQFGETASRTRQRIQHFSESGNRDSGEREGGDAGAVFALAPDSRLGVEPVSSKLRDERLA